MSSIFSKIASGEIPSHKVAENDRYFAFLDIHPLAKGHTLVIPKNETDYIFDLEDEEFRGLFSFARKVAKAIDQVIESKKIGLAVIGLEVAHAHIHLVPMQSLYDLDFSRPKLELSQEEFREIAAKIAEKFQ